MASQYDIKSRALFDELERNGDNAEKASEKLGIPSRTCCRWRARGISEGIYAPKAFHGVEVNKRPALEKAKHRAVKQTARDLESQVEILEAELEAALSLKELLEARTGAPAWLKEPPKKIHNFPGVPTLFASDWHFGEFVNPEVINGVNSYDREIARARGKAFFDRGVDLLANHVTHPNFPGVVLAIGGDMVTGDIHKELAETNDITTPEAVFDLFDIFVYGITLLADKFGKVFAPCVTGNHGRQTEKIQHKNRARKNWDWMLYMLLARHFKSDKRVKFLVPDGTDATFSIYGHRYCLTHGDQFRGGDGMIGALGPIIRGDHRKRGRNGQIGLPYDTLILGHWHQLVMTERVIVNGSLKGYDEYAAANNFGFERPQQAIWLTHPTHGITIRMPIYVGEESDAEKAAKREWVTWTN